VTSKDVRAQLIEALQLDLIGPRTGHPPHDRYAQEVLPVAPFRKGRGHAGVARGRLVGHEEPGSGPQGFASPSG